MEHPRPVPLGRPQFPVELPVVFCVDAGDAHDAPALAFACRLALPQRQPRVNLQPSGLRPPRAALHLQAR